MSWADWLIISVYLTGMILLSAFWAKKQTSQEDYYVGGRNLPWWAVGISTMATQTSAISFISIPAFVALRPGGGLSWLQYELAVPLALIGVMVFLLPFFRKLKLISVYEYLEYRFGPPVRYLMSAVFLLSRGLATGVGVYASGIVLSVCLGVPLWFTILLMGAVTIIYDAIGGIKAVVYSDVIQMGILLLGLLVCIVFAKEIAGNWHELFSAFPAQRWVAFVPESGLEEGSAMPFWAFLIGGLFLYMSYYGTDQSQVQRELSATSVEDSKRSLLFNALARFPLTILYVFLGMAIGASFVHSPALQQAVPQGHWDYLVPQFVRLFLPPGLRGLIFAAILAAAMSSLDSALNSLSASTMRDFIEKGRKFSEKRIVLLSKLSTVGWGILITAFAFAVGHISPTVIEGINKIGSAFYGPILAAFLLGVLSKRITTAGVFGGVLGGVAFNLFLWQKFPFVHWMWWNVSGTLITVMLAYLVSLFGLLPERKKIGPFTLWGSGMFKLERKWLGTYIVLSVYFLAILMFIILI